jgi:hypothetical protein
MAEHWPPIQVVVVVVVVLTAVKMHHRNFELL